MAVNPNSLNSVQQRQQYVMAWNKTMIDIWREKIQKFRAIDSGSLYHSVVALKPMTDANYIDVTMTQHFAEHGLWVELGTGREIAFDNGGDVKARDPAYRADRNLNVPRKRGPKWGGGYTSGNPRVPRTWFHPKYYGSVMAIKDFYCESLGLEFIEMAKLALDTDTLRRGSAHYKAKGYVI